MSYSLFKGSGQNRSKLVYLGRRSVIAHSESLESHEEGMHLIQDLRRLFVWGVD